MRRLSAALHPADRRGHRHLAARQPTRRAGGLAGAPGRLRLSGADLTLCHGVPAGAPAIAQRDRRVARAAGAGPAAADTAVGGARARLFADPAGGELHGSSEARSDRVNRDGHTLTSLWRIWHVPNTYGSANPSPRNRQGITPLHSRSTRHRRGRVRPPAPRSSGGPATRTSRPRPRRPRPGGAGMPGNPGSRSDQAARRSRRRR